MPDSPTPDPKEQAAPELEVSSGQRISLSLIGLLHGLTLGSLLPVLPLFARKTLGFSWQNTAVVVSGLAIGILGAPALLRLGRRCKLGPRLGLALSHMVAGGLVMAMAWWRQTGVGVGEDGAAVVRDPTPILAAICAAAYSLALAPALRWMPEIARGAFPQPGMRGSQTWRLWAAVGFVLPAWISEALLVQIPALRDSVASLDLLLMICGWGGLMTAVAALLGRGESSGAKPSLLQDESTERASLGAGLVIALVFLVMVQKCHHLWTAPYFDDVAQRTRIAEPLVHRLVVVSQVFEVLGLYLLTGLVRLGGARLLMLLGALAWVARSLLLSWMDTAWMISKNPESAAPAFFSSRFQLGVLFVSQVLYGLAVVGFLGALGAVVRREGQNGGGTRVALLIGIATGFGVLLGGMLAENLVSGKPTSLVPFLEKLPAMINAGVPLAFRGWSGVWLLSAGPAAFAALVLLVARLPDRVEARAS